MMGITYKSVSMVKRKLKSAITELCVRMQELTSSQPRKASSTNSPQRQHQHISDSQFRFSYDAPTGSHNRPQSVPVWPQGGDVGQPAAAGQPAGLPAKLKRSFARRPDGNPVTGEGYEPQHYRPSHYGPLKAKAFDDVEKVLIQEALSPGDADQVDSSPLDLNSAPPLRATAIAQRPSSASGRKRVPPGGYSDGLW